MILPFLLRHRTPCVAAVRLLTASGIWEFSEVVWLRVALEGFNELVVATRHHVDARRLAAPYPREGLIVEVCAQPVHHPLEGGPAWGAILCDPPDFRGVVIPVAAGRAGERAAVNVHDGHGGLPPHEERGHLDAPHSRRSGSSPFLRALSLLAG